MTEESREIKAEHPTDKPPAMTEQQRTLTGGGGQSSFGVYRGLQVGDKGLAYFAAFELYNLLFSNMPSALGIATRSFLLPRFLGTCSKRLVVGKGVTVRCPSLLSIGKNVVIDDYALLDVRRGEENNCHDGSGDDSSDTKRNARDGIGDYGIEVGNHVYIGRGTILTARHGRMKIGDGCNISSNCRIATHGSLEIEESVLIAAYVYIGAGNHRFDRLDVPLIEQGMNLTGRVRIGANSWIGARSTILDGVTIGKNAVVGAHSLVRDDVPEGAIVAGTPAKIIRFRD